MTTHSNYQFHSKSSAKGLNARHFILNYNPQHVQLAQDRWGSEVGKVHKHPNMFAKDDHSRWRGRSLDSKQTKALTCYGDSTLASGPSAISGIGQFNGLFVKNVTLEQSNYKYNNPTHPKNSGVVMNRDSTLRDDVTATVKTNHPTTRTHVLSLNAKSNIGKRPLDTYSSRGKHLNHVTSKLKMDPFGVNKTVMPRRHIVDFS